MSIVNKQFGLNFKGHKSLEYCCFVMNLASVSTISYADSNNGIFVLAGSLGCIKPEIDGPESPKLINFKEAFVSEQTPPPKNRLLHGHRNFGTGPGDKFYSPSELTLFRASCFE